MKSGLLLLIAGGGHGRVVLDSALRAGISVDGVIDGALSPGELIFGIPVLGNDSYLESLPASGNSVLNGFGAVKNVERRRTQYSAWLQMGFTVQGVLHPDTIVGNECEIDPSAQILAGAVIQNRVRIAENVVINTAARVDHDCRGGAHCYVSPGAILCGGVTLEESVFVGAGAILVPGTRVGAGSVIGAGSVVIQEVAAGATIVGNPARVI